MDSQDGYMNEDARVQTQQSAKAAQVTLSLLVQVVRVMLQTRARQLAQEENRGGGPQGQGSVACQATVE